MLVCARGHPTAEELRVQSSALPWDHCWAWALTCACLCAGVCYWGVRLATWGTLEWIMGAAEAGARLWPSSGAEWIILWVFWLPAIALLGKITSPHSSKITCIAGEWKVILCWFRLQKWLTLLLLSKKFERLIWMKRKKIWRERKKNNGKSPGSEWSGKERYGKPLVSQSPPLRSAVWNHQLLELATSSSLFPSLPCTISKLSLQLRALAWICCIGRRCLSRMDFLCFDQAKQNPSSLHFLSLSLFLTSDYSISKPGSLAFQFTLSS